MPSYYTDDEREERVEKVMKELSLKKCENSQIGQPGIIKGISGGERKRLSFASELLTNPSLLFCDEPTTGLDSYMSFNVIQMMKDLARTGRTIITTLHQPSSELFHTFDKLCLMADGRTAFLGSLPEADTFFSSIQLPCPKTYNPSDHYIQVLSVVPDREEISKRSVNRICDAFQMSETGMKIKKSSKTTMKAAQDKAKRLAHNKRGHITPYRVGWYDQMKALFPRSWLSVLQNPYATKYKAITVILETSLITLIYYGQVLNQLGIKNLDGVIYFLVFSISFQNIFGVIDTFCEELPIFLKEHKDGMYRTDTYYVTKMISDMPFPLIFAFTSTIICYYLVGLNPDFHKFLMALFICFLISQAAQGEGYVISTLAPNIHLAVILVSVLTLPLLIFGGIFLSSKSVPRWLQWVADLSYFKYGYDALMINQWDDINYIPCKSNSTSCINDGLMVLDSVSIDLGEKWPCIIALIVLAIGFRVIAYFILLYKAYFKD